MARIPIVIPIADLPLPAPLPQPDPPGERRATKILELESGKSWRSRLIGAYFRDARFHVETAVRDSGRRIVPHEFPKRDAPYAEDMGRRAREFTVRGYIIVYPRDGEDVLQKKNYIPARDALVRALEEEGPAMLQLPLLGQLKVACTRYRITEESRLGGYCVFDMSFVEYGQAPATGTRDSKAGIEYAVNKDNKTTIEKTQDGIKKADEAGVNV